MQRLLISIVAGFVSATMAWGAGINYNGTTLQENTDFTRTECGTMKKKTIKSNQLSAISRQSSGDGGIAAIRMARKPNSETDIETTKSDVHCVKVLREGRLYIRLGEKIYDITGRPVF